MRSAVLVGFLCLVGSRVAFGQANSKEIFSENLTVTERTVYVDDSALPALQSAFRRSRSDFLVRIDGARAELVESAAEDPPNLTHLVWLDWNLASHASLAAAANQLASAVLSFPERETFSIVESGRQSLPFQQSLSRTDLVLRLRELASTSTSTGDRAPTFERRIAALNRMAVEVPRYRSGVLGALWLLCEPWAIDPGVFEEILRSDSEAILVHSALGALERTSRILASYGWVIFPVSALRAAPSEELQVSAGENPAKKFLERGPSPRHDRPRAILIRLFGGTERPVSSKESRNLSRSLDLATEFRLTPMALMARATSGALAADTYRIVELADRLRHRRPLVVRDWTNVGADLRRLEVVWLGGDGRALPALSWAASQTPPELGVARLLSVVESASPQVGTPLRLRPSDAAGGIEPALCFAYPRERGALRILWWRNAEQRIEMGKSIRSSASEEGCVPLPRDLEAGDVVQLEVLDSLEWGAGQLSALPRR